MTRDEPDISRRAGERDEIMSMNTQSNGIEGHESDGVTNLPSIVVDHAHHPPRCRITGNNGVNGSSLMNKVVKRHQICSPLKSRLTGVLIDEKPREQFDTS